jgi:hypothetical protein
MLIRPTKLGSLKQIVINHLCSRGTIGEKPPIWGDLGRKRSETSEPQGRLSNIDNLSWGSFVYKAKPKDI